jgi:hypothetical protein
MQNGGLIKNGRNFVLFVEGQPFKLIFYFLYTIRNILTPLVDGHMEKKLANVQEATYPREILTVTSRYGASYIF